MHADPASASVGEAGDPRGAFPCLDRPRHLAEITSWLAAGASAGRATRCGRARARAQFASHGMRVRPAIFDTPVASRRNLPEASPAETTQALQRADVSQHRCAKPSADFGFGTLKSVIFLRFARSGDRRRPPAIGLGAEDVPPAVSPCAAAPRAVRGTPAPGYLRNYESLRTFRLKLFLWSYEYLRCSSSPARAAGGRRDPLAEYVRQGAS